ncbi:ABC transporter permease subunit [Micromonospora sp. NPDC000018]|uniref:ABC transporter permease subunit n=1 Tax=Micromonospora sp. NPDC000018 TaxID=3154239 RepID=UPI00331AA936
MPADAVTYQGAATELGALWRAVHRAVEDVVDHAFYGGWYDRVVTRIIDVLLGFPWLIFVIALGTIVPTSLPKLLLLVGVLAIFGWPGIARVVRGQTLTLKQRTFVVASTALRAGGWHVLVRQPFPAPPARRAGPADQRRSAIRASRLPRNWAACTSTTIREHGDQGDLPVEPLVSVGDGEVPEPTAPDSAGDGGHVDNGDEDEV